MTPIGQLAGNVVEQVKRRRAREFLATLGITPETPHFKRFYTWRSTGVWLAGWGPRPVFEPEIASRKQIGE